MQAVAPRLSLGPPFVGHRRSFKAGRSCCKKDGERGPGKGVPSGAKTGLASPVGSDVGCEGTV